MRTARVRRLTLGACTHILYARVSQWTQTAHARQRVRHGLFDWRNQWAYYVAATAGSALGTKLGDMACKHVAPAAVYWAILGLLLVTGVSLVVGSTQGTLAYVLACGVVALFALAVLFRLQKCRP
nr:putative membrane transporter protein [Pandoravirus belohorizontensis]